MFAPRFDPAQLAPRKRKLSEASERSSEAEPKSREDLNEAEVKSRENSHSESDSSLSGSSLSESDSESGSEASESDDSEANDVSAESSTEEPEPIQEAKTSKEYSDLESKDPEREAENDPEREPKHSNAESNPESQSESESDPQSDMETEDPYAAKYSSVFERFKKSQANQAQLETDQQNQLDEDIPEAIEQMDLAPLPQPELPTDKELHSLSTYHGHLDWLAKPIYTDPLETAPLDTFPLTPIVAENLKRMGILSAFATQLAVFRVLLEDIRRNKLAPDFRGDLLVNAATGSGKTLAYVVPIVDALHTRIVPATRAVVLVPTRPLINQVSQTFRDVARGTPLTVVSLTNDLSIREEAKKICASVPDIVVTTPGRLTDHLASGSLLLHSLRFLVCDEADRLLNQSFQNWSSAVLSHLSGAGKAGTGTGTDKVGKDLKTNGSKANRNKNAGTGLAGTGTGIGGSGWQLPPQKLVFSATLTTDAGKLALLRFTKPRLVVVNSSQQLLRELFTVPGTLHENCLKYTSKQTAYKPLLLGKFLVDEGKLSNVLVFAKSNDATLRLATVLERLLGRLSNKKITVAYINSTNNVSAVRARIFREFQEGNINIVVATDLIARGLDLVTISDVVNYDLPNSSREYVHRVGRTARANQTGHAYTMVFGGGESRWFKTISRDVGREHPVDEIIGGDVGDDEGILREVLSEVSNSS